ncbi:MAG: hypothetical protein SXU28_09225 [Pseudomonadota bacterium]|nr:hypothetical protein [Pseudomonadota bacterium]
MLRLAALALLASTSTVALAEETGSTSVQTQVVKSSEFTQLPAEIQSVISQQNPIQILSIDGVESVEDGIVYVDELIIQRGGQIVFADLDEPYLAIVARRVRVVDAQTPFSIGRVAEWKKLDGAKGPDGPAGPKGGRSGRHGTNGGAGRPGGDGAAGSSFDMPPVYIVIGSIEDARTGATISDWNISYNFDGFRGGNGGAGGKGGRGGNGGKGKNWKSGPFGTCKAGPGRGGSGGTGGRGGNGAVAGDGGDGSTIAFFATQSVADTLTVGDINNYGAEAGSRGGAGRGGDGGSRGGAGNSGNCSDTSNGNNGARGANGNAAAENPNNGKRGEVFAYILPKAAAVFD